MIFVDVPIGNERRIESQRANQIAQKLCFDQKKRKEQVQKKKILYANYSFVKRSVHTLFLASFGWVQCTLPYISSLWISIESIMTDKESVCVVLDKSSIIAPYMDKTQIGDVSKVVDRYQYVKTLHHSVGLHVLRFSFLSSEREVFKKGSPPVAIPPYTLSIDYDL